MSDERTNTRVHTGTVLVLGGTGKTGRRVAAGLEASGVPVRIGSRGATPAFDWDDESGWDAALEAVDAVYISYAPDLAMPGATDAIEGLTEKAKEKGVSQLVLLSGRGEPEAQACERIIQSGGLEWTVVRASWFFQNFSEGAFAAMVENGAIRLPASDVAEPFIDVDDIAEIAVAALTESGHSGRIYEVTGPRLLSFDEVAAELSEAVGRPVTFEPVPHDAFLEEMRRAGAPSDAVWMLDYLFSTVLDGRNAHLTDGVQQALGRPPKDFRTWAREVAATGGWRLAAEVR